jgi:hypothetical protein
VRDKNRKDREDLKDRGREDILPTIFEVFAVFAVSKREEKKGLLPEGGRPLI